MDWNWLAMEAHLQRDGCYLHLETLPALASVNLQVSCSSIPTIRVKVILALPKDNIARGEGEKRYPFDKVWNFTQSQ